ncbi:MAG: hypothetical protein MN733_06230, partial [Nitrososphaera sp.]|nr:hypothetical protein [Nitrososphaera sp.]
GFLGSEDRFIDSSVTQFKNREAMTFTYASTQSPSNGPKVDIITKEVFLDTKLHPRHTVLVVMTVAKAKGFVGDPIDTQFKRFEPLLNAILRSWRVETTHGQ